MQKTIDFLNSKNIRFEIVDDRIIINNGYLHSIAGLLEMAKGLKFKNKKAAAFGSYGWSGEVVKQLTDKLKTAGFEVVDEGVRSLWVPDTNEVANLINYGKSFVEEL